MKRFAFLLWLFTLAAGCIVEDRPVGTGGTGGDVGTGGTGGDEGPCGTCEDPTPVCNLLNNQCVACTEGQVEYCTAQGLACNTELFRCACATDANCTAIDAAKCDLETNACVPCDSRDQCDDVDGLPGVKNACNDDGVCVDCTPESESETCPDLKACNPRTEKCTDTQVGSLDVCDKCVADSECSDNGDPTATYRCVLMTYEGVPFPDDQTGFCLKTTAGGCVRPYTVTLFDRSSLSDPSVEDDYCGIEEDRVTCPAVRALLTDAECPDGTDDECKISGICRAVGSVMNRCTYLCDLPVQCPAGAPANTCGTGGTGGAGGDGGSYCGGVMP